MNNNRINNIFQYQIEIFLDPETKYLLLINTTLKLSVP